MKLTLHLVCTLMLAISVMKAVQVVQKVMAQVVCQGLLCILYMYIKISSSLPPSFADGEDFGVWSEESEYEQPPSVQPQVNPEAEK